MLRVAVSTGLTNLKPEILKPQTLARRDRVFFILTGFFLTNALVAEIIGGKLFAMPPLWFEGFGLDTIILSVGVIPWPVVFITTDIINEYYGKPAVRRLSFLAAFMIAYTFLVLYLAGRVPTWEGSPVSQEAYDEVAIQSMWIIVGSITAFLTSQLVDVMVFWFVRRRTGHRMLWLRATGSTAVSQLIDSWIVAFIAFVVPGRMSMSDFWVLSSANYTYKLLVAIAITPLIYLAHGLIDRYLGLRAARAMEDAAEQASDGSVT
jgi:queuosine precursor transporter